MHLAWGHKARKWQSSDSHQAVEYQSSCPERHQVMSPSWARKVTWHCGYSLIQTPDSFGLQSPTCWVMWAVQFISGTQVIHLPRGKEGSLARWVTGSFGNVVLDYFLELGWQENTEARARGFNPWNRVRTAEWSGGFSRLEIGGPVSVPGGQASDSEQGI